jgi:hypothetical protein
MDRVHCTVSKKKAADVNPPAVPTTLTTRGSWRYPLLQDPYSLFLTNYWPGSGRGSQTGPQVSHPFGSLTSTSTGLGWSTISSSFNNVPSLGTTSSSGWGKQSYGGPKFDGHDRLSLGEGWSLIHGDDDYFLQLDETGLDVPVENISAFHCQPFI